MMTKEKAREFASRWLPAWTGNDPGKLADQLLSVYDRDDSPGAVVSVFRDGKRVFAKAYGMADLTHGIPYTLDTPTNIGSTSKHFTALAVDRRGHAFVGSAPGVPLEESAGGNLVPRDSYTVFEPGGPGFGIDIRAEWLEPFWK